MLSGHFGLIAEYFVALIYKVMFYKILRHRMRNYAGEIDLIVTKGRLIIFIEVKARTSHIDDRLISLKQQTRIVNAATLFLSRNLQYQHYDMRFDLVIVRPYKIPTIIQNAW
jgi:putative endonuclease